jgi:hypothetical protein
LYPVHSPNVPHAKLPGAAYLLIRSTGNVLTLIWQILTFPFYLLIVIVRFLGRLTGILFGFALMVIGMALWAGPFFIIGIPVFLVGLLISLRSLG